jgi:hypothetical protein
MGKCFYSKARWRHFVVIVVLEADEEHSEIPILLRDWRIRMQRVQRYMKGGKGRVLLGYRGGEGIPNLTGIYLLLVRLTALAGICLLLTPLETASGYQKYRTGNVMISWATVSFSAVWSYGNWCSSIGLRQRNCWVVLLDWLIARQNKCQHLSAVSAIAFAVGTGKERVYVCVCLFRTWKVLLLCVMYIAGDKAHFAITLISDCGGKI